MNSIFKILLSLLILIGQFEFSYAQTASILPPAKTTFVDKNGKPLTAGTVEFYIPGTTTHKMTWQDAGQTIPNANPLTLDGSGRAIILGDGSYRQVLKDRYGNVVWDGYTASTGSGGGGTTPTVGDGDAVGTVKPWAGFIAPYGYVFTYGQELTRASYPEAFAALTSEKNVSCSLGSPTLSSVSDTTQLTIGSPIESPCLNAGATVVSKTINSVVASSNAIISTTATARFFPYGNGDGSSTFNVPDFRGLVIAGRDNMGGIAANRLTTTYFANATGLGQIGGLQSSQLNTANLPAYTPSGNIVTTTTLSGSAVAPLWASGAGTLGSIGAGSAYSIGPAITASSVSTFTGVAQGGTQTAFSNVQPTKISNYIIKVIPDTNPNSYFGVASIGGMYGVIECGFGITCAGNTISAVSSVVPAPTLTTLGGIFLSSAPSNQFSTGVDSLGNLTYAQPDFSNISGIVSPIKGGTGLASPTAKSLLVTQGAGNMTLVTGTVGNSSLPLISQGASSDPVYSLLSLGGGGTGASLTASNGGIFWSNATTAQILAGTATARLPLLSGASTTPVWGAFTLPSSVTSGGIPYFSSTSAMVSSPVMTANAFITGGGAGASPNAVTISGLVLGNGASAPTAYTGTTCTNQFTRALSSVGVATCDTVDLASDVTGILPATSFPALTGDVTTSSGNLATTIASNAVTNAKLAQAGAATLKGNPTGSTANVTDFTIQGLTARGAPDATNDKIPLYDNAAGTIKYVTPQQIASAGVAGVSSIDGTSGAFTTANGISTSGTVIQLTSARRTLPTTQVFTSGSGTYTTPANCLWIEVELIGGGGGGAGSGTSPGNGGTGGATTFGSALLTGNGGVGAIANAGGVGGTATGGYLNKPGATGGNGSGLTSSIGGFGAVSPFGGAGSGGAQGAGAGIAAAGNTGSGGGGGGVNATVNGGGGGGAGGYLRAIINTPSATYSYAVGAAGTAGTAGTSGAAGGAGGSGIIIVTEHYGS